jgi:hypothetical protein
MNYKHTELSRAFQALTRLIDEDKNNRLVLSSGVRFRMGSNFRRIKEELTNVEKEQQGLFEKYGTPSTDKATEGQYVVQRTSEKWDEFKKQFDDLQAETVQVHVNGMTEAELINARKVKSRDEKGQVSENDVENQVSIDLIADLQSSGILPTDDPDKT